MTTEKATQKGGNPAVDVSLFPGFATIWACATLVHQLAFTFWAESWPGWLLVLTAIAVLRRPSCLYRFIWLVAASLMNLFNKLPYVPNHILLEGMLHVTMLLAILNSVLWGRGKEFLRPVLRFDWRMGFLLGVVAFKLLYHLLPFVEEGYVMGAITTFLLLVAATCHLFGREPVRGGDEFLSQTAPVIRVAVLLVYFWAAVQKLNWDYINPEYSCAAKLHIDIARYFEPIVPTKAWALHGAVWGSLLFELGIPILLFFRRTRFLGYLAAVWFHLWLSVHPAAGIFSFSSLILALLYLFLPVGMWRELQSLYRRQLRGIGGGDPATGRKRAVRFVTGFFFVLLAIQVTMYLTIERSLDVFHHANRVGFIGFATWALWLGGCYVLAAYRGRGDENFFPNRPAKSLAWLGLLLVMFNGIFPWLGGKTQTSFSMYSNLRTEGRGNHLFLRRIDLFPFQKDLVDVVRAEPNILDPSERPRGIRNFANIGHTVMPYFEFRRILNDTEGDFRVTYEHEGETKTIERSGGRVTGDEGLLEPIPLIARKFLWFRRLNAVEGPMPCTH